MLPTSTDVSVRTKDRAPSNADMVVTFVVEGAQSADARALDPADRKGAERLLSAGVVKGKAKEVAFDLVDGDGRGKHRRVFVLGLGSVEKLTPETLRQAAGAAARAARKHELREVAILVPELDKVTPAEAADAAVTGFLLASFKYREYKGRRSKQNGDANGNGREPGHTNVTVVPPAGEADVVARAVDRAVQVAEAQNFARTIAFRPGNDINPPKLAKVAQDAAREAGLGYRVLDERQMAKLGMGGILGVGAGSSQTPPRMIVLEYKPKGVAGRGVEPVLLVGKAITFDTGGISIKPADRMGTMIFDKCGAMAVLGAMVAVARLKPPVPVVGILASAENHISETAYRPGDILRMYNGVTVEVTNTDAEGRLVLGDALAWGIETYKPSAVVDLATLTGGCVVALGHSYTGLMSNHDGLTAEITAAATVAGEKVWRLPISDEAKDMLKSEPADIVNSAGRWASPLQGGAFLSHFVPDGTPWVHLDIAGPADTDRELPYYSKGATGWGVRTLVEWIRLRSGEPTRASARTSADTGPRGGEPVGMTIKSRRRR